MQLVAHPPADLDGIVWFFGGEIMVAGLQELVDVGPAVLRPDFDAPAPVAGGTMMRGNKLRWAGQVGQCAGGPTVHQERLRWRIVLAAGRGRLDRGDQTQVVQDRQRGGEPVGNIQGNLVLLGRLGLLGDLPGHTDQVHGQPVDRDAKQQLPRQRHGVQACQEPVEEDLVDRQRDRLRQGPVQVTRGVAQPAFGIGDATPIEGGFHARGDVVEASVAAAQQRVQVLKAAGMTANVGPGPLLLIGDEGLQAG